MKRHIFHILIFLSIGINLLIALPAVVLLFTSNSIQCGLYQNILARRFGKPEIVFIGDSLTQGGGIWAIRIGKFDFNVWNYGHGGFTTQQLLHYAKIAAANKETRYAFIMASINDPNKSYEGAEKSFADYKAIIDTLLDGGVTPIIQLTLYRENEKTPIFIDHLNELLVNYSNQMGLTVLDLNTILAPKKSLLPQYSADGIHLTEAAYDVWGNEVKRVLAALRSKPSVSQTKQHPSNLESKEKMANTQ